MGVHGVTVQQLADGERPIGVQSPSAIGLVYPVSGTATGLASGDTVVIRGAKSVQDLGLDLPTADRDLYVVLNAILAQGQCEIVLHAVATGADDTATKANVAGSAVTGDGFYALLGAKAATGIKPKILISPVWSQDAGVFASMVAVAARLHAIAVLDGPDTTEAAAVTHVGTVTDADGRAFLVDPSATWASIAIDGTTVTDEPVGSSAVVAGLIARVDQEEGWWVSPSNHVIYGLSGTGRVIDFELGDANTQAQALNDANIATIIREQGWRLWGNRTLSTDPAYAFLSVRRTADVIAESLKAAHLWAVDKGITKRFGEVMVDSLNAFLRNLKAQGAIINGSAWLDPELNTPTTLAAGEYYIDYDFSAVPVAESITFRGHLTNKYLTEVI